MSKDVLQKWDREIGAARQLVSEWGADQGTHSDTRCIVELAAALQAERTDWQGMKVVLAAAQLRVAELETALWAIDPGRMEKEEQ